LLSESTDRTREQRIQFQNKVFEADNPLMKTRTSGLAMRGRRKSGTVHEKRSNDR